jgi:hypothetical protein
MLRRDYDLMVVRVSEVLCCVILSIIVTLEKSFPVLLPPFPAWWTEQPSDSTSLVQSLVVNHSSIELFGLVLLVEDVGGWIPTLWDNITRC